MSLSTNQPGKHALVLYDGLCGFCDSSIHWVMKRDHRDQFRFAPQQSPLATSVLASFGVDRAAMLQGNSVYLVLNYDGDVASRQLLWRSDVQVAVLRMIGGGWGIAGRLLQFFPKRFRDAGYSFAARNRYRITKRYESCPIPLPAERAKFIG